MENAQTTSTSGLPATFGAILTSTITLSIALAIIAFYIYRRFWCHTYFKRMGIPGPTPHWLFGNLLALSDEGRRHLVFQEWAQLYGKTYGYYEGSTPIIVVTDLDMAKQICIKQFDSFNARKDFPFTDDPESDSLHTNLILARGAKWRRLRHATNPAFTTGNLRRMAPVMYKSIKRCVAILEKEAKAGAEIDIFETFKELAGDVILEAAFGVDMDERRQAGKAVELIAHMQQCFYEESNPKPLVIADTILPEFDPVFRVVQKMQELFYGARASARFIENVALSMMNVRRQDPSSRRADLLQLMMDAAIVNNNDSVKGSPQTPTSVPKQLVGDDVDGEKKSEQKKANGLTEMEIQSSAILFMIAGFETTSTALTYITYLLALNPEAQEKLYKEIVDKVKFDETGLPDTVSLSECHYLDWVLKETLRMYPVAALIMSRMARRHTSVGGIDVPKGQVFFIDTMSLHFNEEIWGPEDPHKFYPERFAPDYGRNSDADNSQALVAFGYGNRRCVGARFAEQEIKITMSMIIRRLKIERTDATLAPLPLRVGMTIVPRDGVKVRFTART